MTRTVLNSLAAALLLASCDVPRTAEPNLESKLDNGDVAKIAVAPDGTVLWGVKAGGRTVFFASRGVQHSVSCGKNCVRQEIVPTAYGEAQ